jgi:sugar/nucleoside kinase (ribokinase family)
VTRFAVVGDVMADVVARHASPLAPGSDTAAVVALRGGGAAGNVAAWLGDRARLIARVGDDAMAAVALEGGLICGVDPALSTGVCVVLVGPDGERTMLPDAGANAALPPPSGIEAEVVYVSGYALLRESSRAAAFAWLDAARAAGARTVVDPASAVPLAAAVAVFERVRCDLLLPNAAEADVLGAERMRTIAAEVVVTRGADGASWSDGVRDLHVAAAPAAVVDTTGAGDAFAAGFLSDWARGPDAALATGVGWAAQAVSAMSSRPAGSH